MAFGDPFDDTINYPENPLQNFKDTSTSLQDIDTLLEGLEKKAYSGDEAAYEKLFDYYATRQAEKTARDWTASREDNQYQRLMADLQKAGISPYILSGATPGVSQAQFSATTGSQMTTQANNKRNIADQYNERGVDVMKSVLSLLGTALMAVAILA